MLLMLLFGGDWNAVPEIPFVGRGFFLISVGFLWYLVGLALDRRGVKPFKEGRVVTVVAVQSFVLMTGVLLLIRYQRSGFCRYLPCRAQCPGF